MKALLTFLCFLLILILAILIGARNEQIISVNYLIAQSDLRISSLMAMTLLMGACIGILAVLPFWLRLKWRVARLQRLAKKSSQVEKV